MVLLDFDTSNVQISENDFKSLPAGEYIVMVTATDLKETARNPDNKYLKITMDVIDGKHKGRKVYENLNLWRANNTENDQTTVKIAEQKLTKLCHAAGVESFGRTEEFHNKPFEVTLRVTPATDKYGEGNAITKYARVGGNNIPTANADGAQTTESASKYPWGKK